MDKKIYKAPEVEVFEIEAEEGFSETTVSTAAKVSDYHFGGTLEEEE